MNKSKFEKLFSPLTIKNLILKNRIVFLPHYNGLGSTKSLPTEEDIYYYGERAKGGAGLIISGNYAVSEDGLMHRTFVNASKKEAIKNFTKITKKVHKFGAKIIGQLTHAGSTKMKKPRVDLYAPSQVIEKSTNSYTIEIDTDKIKEIIESFSKSVENLTESGFDGVEIKIGHDSLLRTFFSPYYNKREDEYGGNFKNRIRIVSELFSLIKERIKNDVILGVRICLDEFDDEGYNLETGIKIAKYLVEKKLADYISSDAGTWDISFIDHSPMSIPLGFSEYMFAALKREVNIPVIAFGRINDPVQAEQILERGSADLIGMARQLICDPETPKKAKKGFIDEIRKCIACNEGCSGQCMYNQPIGCIQNLSTGREKQYGIGTLSKSKIPRKIIVVGGGIAGLKFSEIAAKRGHSIVLFEKNPVFGGQINLLKKIPFRNEFSEVLRYLEYQIHQLDNIDIRIPEEANANSIMYENPDVLIIASGAEPFIPKNIYSKKTMTSWDIFNDKVKIGKNIVIYDRFSGNEGFGIVEYLFELYENIKVQYFTPAKAIGLEVLPESYDVLLRKLMAYDLNINPFYSINRINEEKIVFKKIYTENEYTVNNYDSFINIGNVKSSDGLYWKLKDDIEEVYRIGDAKAPGCVETAIHEAEKLARLV